jgi:hypothetical protein
MTSGSNSTEHWIPNTAEERELVLKELDAILSSYHFRGSKRYPALLKYVVNAALNGRAGDLKERTLGIEVFDRDPDYDTSADTVVRFTAGEVRKRIAQYYHENGLSSRVHIEIPRGSYAPEFILQPAVSAVAENGSRIERRIQTTAGPVTKWRRYRAAVLAVAAVLVAGAVVGAYFYRRALAANNTATDKLWAPLIKPSEPVMIVVGSGKRNADIPELATTSFYDYMTGPQHHVSVATAVALAHVSGVLKEHGGGYEIKEDNEANLADLRSRPMILIGGTNNAWTMRLVSSLRYRLTKGPMAQIQDANNPGNTDWLIDFSRPFPSINIDYAIVARFHDTTTDGPIMIIAGIGPYGTEAASEFVSSPQYLAENLKKLPAGWDSGNLEMVIKTNVIDGKAGPPELVTATVW